MKWLFNNWILFLILLLAILVRVVGLGAYPGSLYWEETALGYDAYSIWKTGKDFHGNSFPIVAFESFGDYKPSGYFYIAAPFVGIFGLNNWSIRLPSALAGIISVGLVYLIAVQLFKKRNVALLAAFTLAILPWHIQFSRAAFEVNLATMWWLLGIWLLLSARQRLWLVFPAGLSMVLSMYTYHGLRLLAPLIVMIISWRYLWKKILSVPVIISVVICCGLLTPLLLNITKPTVAQRFAETSLFSTSQAVNITNELRENDKNTFFARIIHHRYWYWGKEIISGSLRHISLSFLYLDGDANQRHQTGYTGILYWWTLFALGAVVFYKHSNDRQSLIFLALWIMAATLPVALTNVAPHTLRDLPAAPAFALLIGYGLSLLFTHSYKRFIIPAMSLFVIGEAFIYGFDYTHAYQVRSAPDWQYGYQQVVQFIKSLPESTEPVYVTRAYGRPSMYFLYYLTYEPQLLQSQHGLPQDQGELLAFDRYHFGPLDISKKGILVSDIPLSAGSLLKRVDFPTQQPAFYIYENK